MAKDKKLTKDLVWGKRKSKKWIIISVVAVVIVAAAVGYIIFGLDVSDQVSNKSGGSTGESGLVARAIDGVLVPAEESNYYPVAVVIENLVVSRPQSGLAGANIVYEALAEGGITRFLAIYAGQTVGTIGPVRSARPYFVDWVLEYNALYVHAGGSPQSLSDIRQNDVFDLNQFFNSQYYWRDTTLNVASEHTLFTSGEKMTFALRDLEAPEEGDYQSWKYKEEAKKSARPVEEKNIIIDFSSFSYNVEYKYDPNANEYLRYMAGEIHKDKDGTAIRPKNVIVQKVKTRLADEIRLAMDTVGEGDAIIFRDGVATVGTWEKKSKTDRTIFSDMDGSEIELNPGSTWIEVVPTDREIVYN
ncbi:DUF3048 domain-containing protein [Patescibacteria group bacterium]|nr:DUF3048 domain-containing protein [Patescibacteria group bacterium]